MTSTFETTKRTTVRAITECDYRLTLKKYAFTDDHHKEPITTYVVRLETDLDCGEPSSIRSDTFALLSSANNRFDELFAEYIKPMLTHSLRLPSEIRVRLSKNNQRQSGIALMTATLQLVYDDGVITIPVMTGGRDAAVNPPTEFIFTDRDILAGLAADKSGLKVLE